MEEKLGKFILQEREKQIYIQNLHLTAKFTKQEIQKLCPESRLLAMVQNIISLFCIVLCILLIMKCWKKFTSYFESKSRSASDSSRGNVASF